MSGKCVVHTHRRRDVLGVALLRVLERGFNVAVSKLSSLPGSRGKASIGHVFSVFQGTIVGRGH